MDCYYCGIKDNCELPFDTDDGKIIKCDKSCVKFDGYAKDGKRIVVRNCGYFTGKSLSEALILASVNPQYDKRLLIEFQEKYKLTTCCVQKSVFLF